MLGLPFPVLVFAAVAAGMIVLQRMTPFGLLVASIGENERAAYLSGHRIAVTKTLVYGLSGFGAALAGIIQSSQVHTALATYGPFGTELDVIAAVVVGGTSIMGGNGSVAQDRAWRSVPRRAQQRHEHPQRAGRRATDGQGRHHRAGARPGADPLIMPSRIAGGSGRVRAVHRVR